jgi:hypothetical protein
MHETIKFYVTVPLRAIGKISVKNAKSFDKLWRFSLILRYFSERYRGGLLRYDTVRYGTVRYGTVRYGTVRYGTVRYGTVRYGTVRYGTVRYDTVENSDIPHTDITQIRTPYCNRILI